MYQATGPVSRHKYIGYAGARSLSNRYGDAANRVGKRPGFFGRNSAADSVTPSRIGMETIVVGSIAAAGSKLILVIESLTTPLLPALILTFRWIAVRKLWRSAQWFTNKSKSRPWEWCVTDRCMSVKKCNGPRVQNSVQRA